MDDFTAEELKEIKQYFKDGHTFVEYSSPPKDAKLITLQCSGRSMVCGKRDDTLLIYKMYDKVLASNKKSPTQGAHPRMF